MAPLPALRPALDVVTFGCRLNSYESEVMRAHALAAGFQDAVLFNTCAVTAMAVRQARQAIRKMRRERPLATFIVTGCAAQIDPYPFAIMPEVDFVIGNDEKMKAETYALLAQRRQEGRLAGLETDKIRVNDIMTARETAAYLVQGFEGKTRAFIQVQNGCDHRCTFCVIPFGRGPSRSVPVAHVLDQVRALAASYPEIALTGVDITSYGRDLDGTPSLGALVQQILRETEVKRLRLSSLDPFGLDDALWTVVENEPRLMPHLHLSVQAGDDMILKRMKRRHTAQNVRDLCARARQVRPDIVFGADFITGFPTETDAMFLNTVRLVEEAGLTWLHVFPYSAREGTPAAKMPMVPGDVRKERARQLREVGDRAVLAHVARMGGSCVEAHVERPLLARAGDFTEIVLDSPADVGTIQRVRYEGVSGLQALGHVVKE